MGREAELKEKKVNTGLNIEPALPHLLLAARMEHNCKTHLEENAQKNMTKKIVDRH